MSQPTEAQLMEMLDIVEQAKNEGDIETAREMMALYEQSTGAAPAAPAAPPPQAPRPQVSNNPLEVVGGGLDALATLVSGAFATPIAGIAGMVAAGADQIPGVDINAADVVEGAQALLTHDPVSETGRRMLQVAGTPFEKLAEGADEAGDFVLDKTGSPLLAAGARTVIEGAPDIIGLKGARAAGVAAKSARRVAPTAEGRVLQQHDVRLKRSDMSGNRNSEYAQEAVLGESSFDVKQAGDFNEAVMRAAGGKTNTQRRITDAEIRDLKEDISKDYNDLHSRRDTPLDVQLATDLNARVAEAAADALDVGDPMARRVIAQVDKFRELARNNGGRVPGQAGQRIRSKLGEIAAGDDGPVARFAHEVQDAMDAAWERAAPGADRAKMKRTRERFRMQLAIQKAMRRNATGNLSPAQLFAQTDMNHPLRELAYSAKNVLTDRLGNSGTPQRAGSGMKLFAMMNPNHWGDLARTVGGAAGGRFLNESPNIGAKAGALARQRSPQLVAAGSAGEAMLAEEDRRTQEFLRALGY